MLPNTTFQEWLSYHAACREARVWVGKRSLEQSIADLPDDHRGWLAWLVEHALSPKCTCAKDGPLSDDCPLSILSNCLTVADILKLYPVAAIAEAFEKWQKEDKENEA